MAKKKKSSSSNKKRQNTKQERMQKLELQEEIELWLMVALSIFLFISNFNRGGSVGAIISGALFGVFGIINYIFPILLLFGTFFVVSNRGNSIAIVKMVALIAFVISACMLFALLHYGSDCVGPIESFKASREGKNAGGIIGGTIAFYCVPAIGLLGTYILDVLVLLISFIVFTGKSAMKGVKRFGSFVGDKSRETRENNREYREEKALQRAHDREEKKKKRYEQKHEGVSLDTKIEDRKKQKKNSISDEMGEVRSEQFPSVKEKSKAKVSSDDTDRMSELFAEPEIIPEPEIVSETVFPVEPEPVQEPDNLFDESQKEEFVEPEVKEKKAKKAMPEGELSQETNEVESLIENSQDVSDYSFPPISLLSGPGGSQGGESRETLEETKNRLAKTLEMFNVGADVTDYSCGPAVTRFEITPRPGVKVSKIVGLADDIKLNLAAEDIRIEAPIPGKAAVGIEVPNKKNTVVNFRELIESPDFQNSKSNISFALGKDIGGKIKIGDIAKMPHVLIAGATGSGKSVCINTIIMSILYKADPRDVKLIMIDPKVVELSVYNGIPHLLIPVVTDAKKAAGALNWAVSEMTNRYELFAQYGVRKIDEFNSKIDRIDVPEGQERPEKMPLIVVVVDELADLMMVASKEVEESICRLAQLARAAGIHLIIATQRPSVNVITGLIKANMPSRIAFAVTSGIDSRTILDSTGAEKLLGKGDMLYDPQGSPKPQRVQGAFVTDEDVAKVVEFIKENNQSQSSRAAEIQQKIEAASVSQNTTVQISDNEAADDGRDSLFWEAGKIIVDKEKASIGMLQRFLKVGFNRAARIMDQLEEAGVVGPELGTKPRTVLMDMEQFEAFKNQE